MIVRKSNSKYSIWDHFGLKAAEDGKAVEDGKPICFHCKHSVAVRWGSTTSLFSHLRLAHPNQYELAQRGKETKSADFIYACINKTVMDYKLVLLVGI